MPRELIYGRAVTVRRGDLLPEPPPDSPAADDLATGLELVRQLQSAHDALRASDAEVTALRAELADQRAAWSVLRRRHQLLSQFADDVQALAGTNHLVTRDALARRLEELHAALDRLPLDGPADFELPPTPAELDARANAAELAALRQFVAWLGRYADQSLDNADDESDETGRVIHAVLDPLARRHAELADVLARARDVASSTPALTDPDPAALPCGCYADNCGCELDYGDEDEDEDEDGDATASKLAEVAAQPRRFRRDGESPQLDDADPVRVRPALELTWVRDGANLTARVVFHDEDTNEPVTLREPVPLDLDWTATNRAIKKFRVARDQGHGTPE
jgi:hypothetical protein